MKSHTEHLTFNVPKRMDFVNITAQVEDAVEKREGENTKRALAGALLLYDLPDAIPASPREPSRVTMKELDDITGAIPATGACRGA